MSRAYYSSQAMYEKLLSLSDADGKVVAPDGTDLVTFLTLQFGWTNRITLFKNLKKLEEELGLIKINRDHDRFVSLTLLKLPPRPKSSPDVPSAASPSPLDNEPKRRFAILIDYENLERNVSPDRLSDFSWLISPLLEEGVIVQAMVFFPEHMVGRVPIRTLSNLERFLCVVCPREHRGQTKTVDRVDTRMSEEGVFLADHSDVTDIVVISGDGDFHALIKFAHYHGKRVRHIAPQDAVAGRLVGDSAIHTTVLI